MGNHFAKRPRTGRLRTTRHEEPMVIKGSKHPRILWQLTTYDCIPTVEEGCYSVRCYKRSKCSNKLDPSICKTSSGMVKIEDSKAIIKWNFFLSMNKIVASVNVHKTAVSILIAFLFKMHCFLHSTDLLESNTC